MVSTRSTPSKRPAATAAAEATPAAFSSSSSSSPSPSSPPPPPSPSSASRAEQTTASINSQITSAIPSTVPTSPADLPSLPTLDDAAPPAQAAKSHLVLAGLVVGCVALGWLVGFDLLQVAAGHNSWLDLAALLVGLAVVLVAVLHGVGLAKIDFAAMLEGYWWLSVPIAVAALAAVTVMQERATELHEVE